MGVSDDDDDDDDCGVMKSSRSSTFFILKKAEEKAEKFKQTSKGYRRIYCIPSFSLGLVMASRIHSHYVHAPWFRLTSLNGMIDIHGTVGNPAAARSLFSLDHAALDHSNACSSSGVRDAFEKFDALYDELGIHNLFASFICDDLQLLASKLVSIKRAALLMLTCKQLKTSANEQNSYPYPLCNHSLHYLPMALQGLQI